MVFFDPDPASIDSCISSEKIKIFNEIDHAFRIELDVFCQG